MKRSKNLHLVGAMKKTMLTVAIAAALTGCDQEPQVFKTLEECRSASYTDEDGNPQPSYTEQQCKDAIAKAQEEHAKSAPHYADKAACEAVHGVGNCSDPGAGGSTQANNGGGSSPLLWYMLGRMGNNSSYAAYPSVSGVNHFQTATGRSFTTPTIGSGLISRSGGGSAVGTVSRSGFGGRSSGSFGG